MLDFLANYGPEITAFVVALGSLAASVYGIVTAFKTGKKVDANNQTTQEEIQITREGIVEAFKTAKIPNEWKISVSKQVNETLTAATDKIISLIKQNEALRTDMMVLILKILDYTAASNKLTDDEKAKVQELIALVTEEDATIDISSDTTNTTV